MFHSTIRNRLNIIAVIFLTTGMFSQAEAQDPLSLACPNGYAFLEPICLNEMSGDVVNSHPTMLLSGAARTTPSSSASGHPVQNAMEILQTCAMRDLTAGDFD